MGKGNVSDSAAPSSSDPPPGSPIAADLAQVDPRPTGEWEALRPEGVRAERRRQRNHAKSHGRSSGTTVALFSVMTTTQTIRTTVHELGADFECGSRTTQIRRSIARPGAWVVTGSDGRTQIRDDYYDARTEAVARVTAVVRS